MYLSDKDHLPDKRGSLLSDSPPRSKCGPDIEIISIIWETSALSSVVLPTECSVQTWHYRALSADRLYGRWQHQSSPVVRAPETWHHRYRVVLICVYIINLNRFLNTIPNGFLWAWYTVNIIFHSWITYSPSILREILIHPRTSLWFFFVEDMTIESVFTIVLLWPRFDYRSMCDRIRWCVRYRFAFSSYGLRCFRYYYFSDTPGSSRSLIYNNCITN